MTREELKQIPALKQEIKLIQKELQNLPCTTDSVTGSDSEFPYIKHVIRIHGFDEDKGTRLRRKLEYKLEELQDILLEMEKWLDTIEDAEARVILRLKFRNGMTDRDIGSELGYDRSTISLKIREFFENK